MQTKQGLYVSELINWCGTWFDFYHKLILSPRVSATASRSPVTSSLPVLLVISRLQRRAESLRLRIRAAKGQTPRRRCSRPCQAFMCWRHRLALSPVPRCETAEPSNNWSSRGLVFRNEERAQVCRCNYPREPHAT